MSPQELEDATATATKLFAYSRTMNEGSDRTLIAFAAGMLAGQAHRLWMAEEGGRLETYKYLMREATITLWNKGETEWVRINQPGIWAELNPQLEMDGET